MASSRAINVEELKALFHVKTWGREDRHLGVTHGFPEKKTDKPATGEVAPVKTVLEFYDGEKIFGYSIDYDPDRRGFFVLPADPGDNNSKIFVVTSSLVNIQFMQD